MWVLCLACSSFRASGDPIIPQELTYAPGSQITLTNQAGPGTDYQWFKNGLPMFDSSHIQGVRSETLIISDCFPDYSQFTGDEGTYVLTSGTDPVLTNSTYVIRLETITGSFTIPPGGVIRLSGGKGGSNYQWFKDGDLLSDRTLATERITGSQTSDLLIEGAPVSDGGTYALECLVGWDPFLFGTIVTNAQFELHVADVPPSIPPRIDNFFVLTAADDVTFTVEASGQQISYQWYWQGHPIPGATKNILEYPHAFLQASAGYYSVVVSNQFGSVSSSPPGFLFTKSWPTGTYQGLFFNAAPDAVTMESSGLIQYKLSGTKGAFSGKITLNNQSYPFSGVFGRDHSSQVTVRGTSLALDLQLVATNDTAQVFGTVTSEDWVSPLHGHRLFYSSKNPFPQSGKFNLTMMNTNFLPTYPNGVSFATIKVSSSGNATLAGRLSDDTVIVESFGLSKTGDLLLHVPFLKGRGRVFGWLQFTNQAGGSISGEPILWMKGAGSDKRYPDGFTSKMLAQGSTYTGPAGRQILPFTDGVVSFTAGDFITSGGDFLWDFARVSVSPPGLSWQKVKYGYHGDAPENVWIDINPLSGTFTGHFVDESTRLVTPIKGTVLQQQGVGVGYFLSPGASGYLSLTPFQ